MKAAGVPHNSIPWPGIKEGPPGCTWRWGNTQPASAAPRAGLAEPLPAVPAGLGTGGEARDLDVVPIFPLKLLFSRDSSSAYTADICGGGGSESSHPHVALTCPRGQAGVVWEADICPRPL